MRLQSEGHSAEDHGPNPEVQLKEVGDSGLVCEAGVGKIVSMPA